MCLRSSRPLSAQLTVAVTLGFGAEPYPEEIYD